MKHIYIFNAENGECKIGVSKNVEVRKRTIELQGGKKITNVFYTPQCSNGFEIEALLHKYYKDKRMFGEWFDIDFNEAVCTLKKTFEEKAEHFDNKYVLYSNKEHDINTNNDDIIYKFYSTNNQSDGMIFYFEMNNSLTQNESLVLAVLRSLYSDKFNNSFIVSLGCIGYYITNTYLNTSNSKDRLIINKLKESIDSLFKKGIIKIKDKYSCDNYYVLNSNGLKLSEIDTDKLVGLDIYTINNIFKNSNKPFDIIHFYTKLIHIMKNNICQISQDDMVKKFGGNKKTISNYLNQLENMNLLKIKKKYKRGFDGKIHNENSIYSI